MNEELATAAQGVAVRLLILRLDLLISKQRPGFELSELVENLRGLAMQIEEYALRLDKSSGGTSLQG